MRVAGAVQKPGAAELAGLHPGFSMYSSPLPLVKSHALPPSRQ